jgi:type II secretion system protein H
MRSHRLRDTHRSLAHLRARGFTLLELMMVVVVVGILVSIFTLSMGSYADDATNEHARRLEALISLALEEAGINGRELGLRFYQHGYEFSSRQPAQDEDGRQVWLWVPLDADRILKPRDFGDEISVDLEIEGKEIVLEFERSEDFTADKQDEPEKDNDNEAEEGYQPQIFLLSSGDIEPPFNARIRAVYANKGVVLNVEPNGTIELVHDEY